MAISPKKGLFDTSDPNNNLGPFVTAVLIAIATVLIAMAIGLSRAHH